MLHNLSRYLPWYLPRRTIASTVVHITWPVRTRPRRRKVSFPRENRCLKRLLRVISRRTPRDDTDGESLLRCMFTCNDCNGRVSRHWSWRDRVSTTAVLFLKLHWVFIQQVVHTNKMCLSFWKRCWAARRCEKLATEILQVTALGIWLQPLQAFANIYQIFETRQVVIPKKKKIFFLRAVQSSFLLWVESLLESAFSNVF